MSRSEEFVAGQGDRNPYEIHPNLTHYRDGGVGGIGPEHNVVGMVPVSVLDRLKHYDRANNREHMNADSLEIIESIREDLRSGHGLKNPLMVMYSKADQWAYLGEGNHRLAAAKAEGLTHLPVRVARTPDVSDYKRYGIGRPAMNRHIPGVDHADPRYIPTDIHPDYMEFL